MGQIVKHMKALIDSLISRLRLQNFQAILMATSCFRPVGRQQCFYGMNRHVKRRCHDPIRKLGRNVLKKLPIMLPLFEMFVDARQPIPSLGLIRRPHTVGSVGNKTVEFPARNLARFRIADRAARIQVDVQFGLFGRKLEVELLALGDDVEHDLF